MVVVSSRVRQAARNGYITMPSDGRSNTDARLLTNKARRVMRELFKSLGLLLGILACYVLISLFCFWLFSGAFGDWLAYGIGAVLIGAYVIGAALGLWR